MPAPADLVHEASTTTGTGNLTLSEINGKRRFSSPFGTGGSNVFDYFVSHRGAVEWERGTGSMSDANTLVRDTVIASSNSNSAVNFSAGLKDVTNDIPAANQVYNENATVTDGHAVLFDGTTGRKLKSAGAAPYVAGGTDVPVADGGTGASTAQAARASLQAASFDAGASLGLLTNPFFEISQENGTTLVSSIGVGGAYPADQWLASEDSDTVCSVQNVVDPFSGTATLRRLSNSIKATATTADASFGASQYVQFALQSIEGTFWRSLGWGTADARAIDVVFIAQCSVTGTYPVALRTYDATRSYVTTVALTANTPTVCMVTIPGDTSGTWVTTNAGSARIGIGNISGSTFQVGSLNTWSAGNFISHSSCTNWAASGTTNFFQVAYCQAFPAGVLPFTSAAQITGEALQLLLNMRRPYEAELLRCQRYYEKSFDAGTNPAQNAGFNGALFQSASAGAGTSVDFPARFQATKRTVPTVTLYNPSASNAEIYNTFTGTSFSGSSGSNAGTGGFRAVGTSPASTAASHSCAVHYVASARM